MSALDDATTRITQKVDQLIEAVKAGQGGGANTDADVAALNAASDRADEALAQPAGTTATGGDTTGGTADTTNDPNAGNLNPPA